MLFNLIFFFLKLRFGGVGGGGSWGLEYYWVRTRYGKLLM